jgi:succinate dehydrogenase/fumarate reductase flavoprotein subunit
VAGKAFQVIDVVDLSHVRGGFERSLAVQHALAQALGGSTMSGHALGGNTLGGSTMSGHALAGYVPGRYAQGEYADSDGAARIKDDDVVKAPLSLLSRKPHRRSGSGPASGPTPAPALPPTSTLTR